MPEPDYISALVKSILSQIEELHSLVNPTDDEVKEFYNFHEQGFEDNAVESLNESLGILSLRDIIAERNAEESGQ